MTLYSSLLCGAAVLSASLMALSARADCPTGAAMSDRGVVVTTASGNVELHQRNGDDKIQIAVNFGGGDGSLLEMQHGVYMIRKFDLVDGVLNPESEERAMSGATAQAWEIPTPLHVWQNARRGGGSAASGGTRTIRIGTCSYNGFDVSIRFMDDPNYVETYAYLPEFGIGLLTSSDNNGDVERYRYVSISAY